MGQPVVHFEIASLRPGEATEFYSKLLGWKIDANNPMQYGMINPADGAGINGGIYQSEEGRSFTLIYAAVKDVDAVLKRAVALGGTIVKPVEVIPGMVTYALFADPSGNVMGLVKDEMPQAEKKSKPAAKASAAKPARKTAKRAAKKPVRKPAAKEKSKPAKPARKKR